MQHSVAVRTNQSQIGQACFLSRQLLKQTHELLMTVGLILVMALGLYTVVISKWPTVELSQPLVERYSPQRMDTVTEGHQVPR